MASRTAAGPPCAGRARPPPGDRHEPVDVRPHVARKRGDQRVREQLRVAELAGERDGLAAHRRARLQRRLVAQRPREAREQPARSACRSRRSPPVPPPAAGRAAGRPRRAARRPGRRTRAPRGRGRRAGPPPARAPPRPGTGPSDAASAARGGERVAGRQQQRDALGAVRRALPVERGEREAEQPGGLLVGVRVERAPCAARAARERLGVVARGPRVPRELGEQGRVGAAGEPLEHLAATCPWRRIRRALVRPS